MDNERTYSLVEIEFKKNGRIIYSMKDWKRYPITNNQEKYYDKR